MAGCHETSDSVTKLADTHESVREPSTRSDDCWGGIPLNQARSLPITRLELYSLNHPQEVLSVKATVEGEDDEVLVFKGYSSSLVRPTAAELDVPVLPAGAVIAFVSRLQAPYDPKAPVFLERDITWAQFEHYLAREGC